MIYEVKFQLPVERGAVQGMYGYEAECGHIDDVEIIGNHFVDASIENRIGVAGEDVRIKPYRFVGSADEEATHPYFQDMEGEDSFTKTCALGELPNHSQFSLQIEDYPYGYKKGMEYSDFDKLKKSSDVLFLTLKICNENEDDLEQDRNLVEKQFKAFQEDISFNDKKLTIKENTELFTERAYYLLREMQKKKENNELEFIKDIAYSFSSEFGEKLMVGLTSLPQSLPMGENVHYVETDMKSFPYRKKVIIDDVLYDSMLTKEEYEKDRAGEINFNGVSKETTDYLGKLAKEWDKTLKNVYLIQFDKALCHNKADLKVMVNDVNLPLKKSSFYSLKTDAYVRREKAVFVQRGGVRMEFFTLQTENEYKRDLAILQQLKIKVQSDDKEAVNDRKK